MNPTLPVKIGCLCRIKFKCFGFDQAKDNQTGNIRFSFKSNTLVLYLGVVEDPGLEFVWTKILHQSGVWYIRKHYLTVEQHL